MAARRVREHPGRLRAGQARLGCRAVVAGQSAEPLLDQFDVMLRSRNPFPGFLLKDVKNVDYRCESYRVDSAQRL